MLQSSRDGLFCPCDVPESECNAEGAGNEGLGVTVSIVGKVGKVSTGYEKKEAKDEKEKEEPEGEWV